MPSVCCIKDLRVTLRELPTRAQEQPKEMLGKQAVQTDGTIFRKLKAAETLL